MPVFFPTDLSTPEGSTHNLIDLNNNNVKGIGFFDTLTEAQSLNANQRCLGYLAVVSNGTDAGTTYQYTGTDIVGWASNTNWTELGSSVPPPSTSNRVLHHDISTTVMLSQKAPSTAFGQALTTSPTAADIPEELEIRFDGATTLGYNVEGGASPYSIEPEFIKDLYDATAHKFDLVDGDYPLSSCVVRATATIGDTSYFLGVGDSGNNSKYSGISSASTTALAAGSWASPAHNDLIAFLGSLHDVIVTASGGSGTATANLAYIPILPVEGGDGKLYFIQFDATTDTGSGVSLTDFTNASNWTVVYAAGTPHIAVYAWLHDTSPSINQEVYAGGQSPSVHLIGTGANVGASGNLDTDIRIDTLGKLKERLRIKLKINSAAAAAIVNAVNATHHGATWKDLAMRIDVGITITQ